MSEQAIATGRDKERAKAAMRAAKRAHVCPEVCHLCPQMQGMVFPFCYGTACSAMDEYDLTSCTCAASACMCGRPSGVCRCVHLPLVARQLMIVEHADAAFRIAKERGYELRRMQNELERFAREVIGGGFTRHGGRVNDWYRLLDIMGRRRAHDPSVAK